MPKRPGTFGPLIIGAEKYATEQKVVAKRAHKFGSLVTGEPAQEESAATTEPLDEALRIAGLDPDKLKQNLAAVPAIAEAVAQKIVAQSAAEAPAGETPPAASAEPAPADADGNGYTTIAELLRALNSDAVTVEAALAQELASKSPRKGALAAINARELQRAGGPRAEVLQAIEQATASLSA